MDTTAITHEEFKELEKRLRDLEKEGELRHELLIRIDERTRQMAETLATLLASYVRKEEVDEIKKNYVRMERFKITELISYGLVATVLVQVLRYLLKF